MRSYGSNQALIQAKKSSFTTRRRNILNKKTSFHIREAFKSLRTNIRFFQASEGCRRFCITSSSAGEGKSITILNLAITFAEANQKVLLVDADLRRPTLARLLIEHGNPGLSNVLAGHCTPGEAIHKDVYPNLDVMFSGEIPPNPSELLDSRRLKQMMEQLSSQYDYILADTAPAGIVSDACLVAAAMDGMLYLVRQNKTDKDTFGRTIKMIEHAGVRLMGFIINGYEEERFGSYKYKYRYRYKYKYNYEATAKPDRKKKDRAGKKK